MRQKGTITSWNHERGFGFIKPAAGGKEIFVHIKEFNHRNEPPAIDQPVTYTLSTDKKGRPCAVNAAAAGHFLPQNILRKNGAQSAAAAAALFLTVVAVSVLAAQIPVLILILYVVASLITFIIYAVDKAAAGNGGRRTPENTLHLLSLVGGWPGALIAQQTLRHKTQKQPFRLVFWITVFLNCALYVWQFTPGGAAALQDLIASLL